jgi:hypothetical protein
MRWTYWWNRSRGSAGWLILSALLLVSAGCGGGGSSFVGSNGGGTSSGSSVQGRVVYRISPHPNKNATVTVGGNSATTGADGKFNLPASAGTISIQVSAATYNPGTFSAVVDKNQAADAGDLPLSSADSGPPAPPL